MVFYKFVVSPPRHDEDSSTIYYVLGTVHCPWLLGAEATGRGQGRQAAHALEPAWCIASHLSFTGTLFSSRFKNKKTKAQKG